MTIAVSILGLAVLVLVHELGHFLVSLALGMRPRRFYVGFPPAVWSTTRGGVEYAIGAIPLGGFVKIPGMHRPLAADADAAFGRVVAGAPALERDVARVRTALAADDHVGAREALAGLRSQGERAHLGEHERAALGRGLDDLEDALGPGAYWRAPTWRRVAVIAAGPAANIVLAFALLAGLLATSDLTATTRVESVRVGSPAARAGVRAGDRLVSIDGHALTPSDVATRVAASEGRPLRLIVVRGGREVPLPAFAPRHDRGAWRIGIMLAGEPMPPGRALVRSGQLVGLVSVEIVRSLGRLRTSEGREDLASPVGIVQGSSHAAKEGPAAFIGVLALLSLSIALLNLLPLLPLDGGHIVFAVAEGVRGRAVARRVYERISMVGIAVVLVLFVIGLQNDLDRLSP